MKSHCAIVTIFSLFLFLAVGTKSQDFPDGSCGWQTNHTKVCDDGFCCSNRGDCGTTEYFCAPDYCQSQCWQSPPPPKPSPPPPPRSPPPPKPSPPPPPPSPPPPKPSPPPPPPSPPPPKPSPPPPPPSPPPPKPSPPPPPPSPPPPKPSPPPPPPSPPPPTPSPPLLCGMQNENKTCPGDDLCCTVEGFCENKESYLCDAGNCQSQCPGTPTCGVQAEGRRCPEFVNCCTNAGLCAPINSPACAYSCQSQCPPRISMVTAIA